MFVKVLRATISGIILGNIISIPTGPGSLEAVKRTMSDGIKEGFKVSLGVIFSDILDIILINYGLLNLLDENKTMLSFFWIISGVIMIVMGYLSYKKQRRVENNPHYEEIRNTGKKSSPFMTGFLMSVTNPLVHSTWLTLSGTIMMKWGPLGSFTHNSFIFSIIIGMLIWHIFLNCLANKGNNIIKPSHSKFISSALTILIFFIGIFFIANGIYKYMTLVK